MLKKLQDNINTLEVTNGFITFKFYKTSQKQGTYEIRQKNNDGTECFIRDCYSNINYFEIETGNIKSFTSMEFQYEHQTESIEDALGKGLKII